MATLVRVVRLMMFPESSERICSFTHILAFPKRGRRIAAALSGAAYSVLLYLGKVRYSVRYFNNQSPDIEFVYLEILVTSL